MAGFRGDGWREGDEDDEGLARDFEASYEVHGDVARAYLDARRRRAHRERARADRAPTAGRRMATRTLGPGAAYEPRRMSPGKATVTGWLPPAAVARSADGAVLPDAARRLEAARQRGSEPLDPALRASLERALGADLGHVRVHRDGEADAAARALGARAFAVGDDVFFRAGAYDPASRDGQRLIAHEVAHTLQPTAAPAAGGLAVSEPGDAHEREADDVADRFVRALHGDGRAPALAPSRHAPRPGAASARVLRDKDPPDGGAPPGGAPVTPPPSAPPTSGPSTAPSTAQPTAQPTAPAPQPGGPQAAPPQGAPQPPPQGAPGPAPQPGAPAPQGGPQPPPQGAPGPAPQPGGPQVASPPVPAPAAPAPMASPPMSSPAAAEAAERIRAAADAAKQAADQAYAAKRTDILARVDAAAQAIQAAGQQRSQAMLADLAAREQAARASYTRARAGITEAQAAQRAAAQADETQAIADLQRTVADKRRAATEAASAEAQATIDAGNTQAARARSVAASACAAIDQAAAQAESATTSSDEHVRQEVHTQVQQQATAIKADLHDRGEQTAGGVLQSAQPVADSIRQAGQQVADSVAQHAGDVEQQLRSGTADVQAAIDQSAQDSLTRLEQGEQQLADGFEQARAQVSAGVAAATTQAMQHVQDLGQQALAGLDGGRADALAGFDQAAAHVLGQLAAAPDASPEDIAAFEQQATALFGQLQAEITSNLDGAGTEATGGLDQAQTGFTQALDQQAQQTQQRAEQLVADLGEIDQAPAQFVARCQDSREQLLASRQQAIQRYASEADGRIAEARTGWVQQRTDVEGRMRGQVDQLETACGQVQTNAAPRFQDAATQAARSAGGSWLSNAWEGIKRGFSRFIDGLLPFLIAFVVVFVIAAIILAIAAGGVTLAVLGAAAGIALLIVGVVALVIGLVMAIIHRVQQLWNAPYPWWVKVLMVVSGYVSLVIVGDVLGLTPLLEGIFGRDAITFERLSTQERWARVTQGVLNILLFLLLHRAAKGARGGRGGGGEGGDGAGDGTGDGTGDGQGNGDGQGQGRGQGDGQGNGDGQGQGNGDPNHQPDPNQPDPNQPNPNQPDPNQPDPNQPDPNQPDPNRPDPNQPDPNQPDPNQPDPNQPRPAYDPATRSIEELRTDAHDGPRPGETDADATARRNAATDELFRRADTALPEQPRQVDVRAEENTGRGDHALARHGADIPYRRTDAPAGARTIEGRIYGDPPWTRPENFSFQWISDAVMNNVVNRIIADNWAQLRLELVVEGRTARTVDTGNLSGRGFVNEGAAGFGPRNAVEARTSRATVVLEFDPGPPPDFHVYTAYPDGSYPLQ